MEEEVIYQIKITFEDGIQLVIYTNGKKDQADIILDYGYQIYWEQQPDISMYQVTSLSEDPSILEGPNGILRLHLAHRASEYSENYN